MAKAKYYLMTCRPLCGAETGQIGLVSLCVEADSDLLPTAREVAHDLAVSAPTAVRWTKQSLNNWYRHVAGSIFDASLPLEFYGFGGPRSARAWPSTARAAAAFLTAPQGHRRSRMHWRTERLLWIVQIFYIILNLGGPMTEASPADTPGAAHRAPQNGPGRRTPTHINRRTLSKEDLPVEPIWINALRPRAQVQDWAEKAVAAGADALILDLEDSVPAADKADARQTVRETIGRLREQGTRADVSVRPNSYDSGLFGADAEEVIVPGLDGLFLPKVFTATEIVGFDAVVSHIEERECLNPGSVGLIVSFETAVSIAHCDEIACASPRVSSLLGATGPNADVGRELGSSSPRKGWRACTSAAA